MKTEISKKQRNNVIYLGDAAWYQRQNNIELPSITLNDLIKFIQNERT